MILQKLIYLALASLITIGTLTANALECGVPVTVNIIRNPKVGHDFQATEIVMENGSKFNPVFGINDSDVTTSLTTAVAANLKVCLEERLKFYYVKSISKY